MMDRLAAQTGKEYWRSLEQLADAPGFRELVSKEFPGYDADSMSQTSRRRFLKLMGASLALAGFTLTGCRRWPQEKLAPYTASPQGRLPGVPEQYATVMETNGVAQGLLVTSFDGRPIKIEGNPSHPFSWTIQDKIGSADAMAQASVLELYDPNRSRRVTFRNGINQRGTKASTWNDFRSAMETTLASNGVKLAVLSEATSSPSLLEVKGRLLAAHPSARWFEYEPISDDNELEGARLAFGKPVRTQLKLDKASVIISLDADLLGSHSAHTRYAADWASGRRSADSTSADSVPTMNRLLVAESTFSITGAVADVRLPVDPSRLIVLARAIAENVGIKAFSDGGAPKLTRDEDAFVAAATTGLKTPGKPAVMACGPTAPPEAHALCHLVNQAIGAIGTTVTLLDDPAFSRPSHIKSITDLASAITEKQVDVLLIIGGNPAYDAPVDLGLTKLLPTVPTTVRLGLYEDETSALCNWHLPRAHYLESWNDARGYDGTLSIVQPLIEPLFGGKTPAEVLTMLVGDDVSSDQIVRHAWARFIPGEFEINFRRALEKGLLAGTEYKQFTPPAGLAPQLGMPSAAPPPHSPGTFTLRFEVDPRVYDGRFANNGWLQETPSPVSKIMWDNAALMAKKDADALGLTTGDMVNIALGNLQGMNIAVYVMPGQPVGVIGLPLGYGRDVAELKIAHRLGFNTYFLRTSQHPCFAGGATVKKLGHSYDLALTQNHHIIDDIGAHARDERIGAKNQSGPIIHETSFAAYTQNARSAHGDTRRIELQLFSPPSKFNDTHAWGMAVDLNTCIGCNACAVACQSENNIPIVGKHEALNHREMNWIRIDRYFKGAAEDPSIEVAYQPMMCQHCENAPCEEVCPVAATVHDSEGLNTMVYNRCIGTRYCSNNCPYKVRRFNYFDYHSQDPRSTGMPYLGIPDEQQNSTVDKIKQMVFNPQVTIRMRGVMEKCTYCVQRIHTTVAAKRTASADGNGDIHDGDIITACQQACPTQAIVFGDLNDPNSRVTQLHKSNRAYAVLNEELNTRPRTLYLAKLRNQPEAI